ncbi:hypothetical protein CLOP_g14392, partial [Closterium sp. NIES-67]
LLPGEGSLFLRRLKRDVGSSRCMLCVSMLMWCTPIPVHPLLSTEIAVVMVWVGLGWEVLVGGRLSCRRTCGCGECKGEH